MNRVPKIGERVRFRGNAQVGPCTGTVLELFEEYDGEVCSAPEEWHVMIALDARPPLYPAKWKNTFAAKVSFLEVADV